MPFYRVTLSNIHGDRIKIFSRISKEDFEKWAREHCTYKGDYWVLNGTSCTIKCKLIE